MTFTGTDYLAMSVDRDVRTAAIDAIERHGVSASASRSMTGTLAVHVELELALAEFLQVDDAVVVASGGHAAAAVIEGLRDRVGNWLVDEGAHHSIQAALAGHGRVRGYAHRDPTALAGMHDPGASSGLVTDAVFPEIGHTAPIEAIARATDASVLLCVDESHSVGVLGAGGRGLAHELSGRRDHMQFGSLAKAFGGFGGFVAGPRDVCDAVRERSGAYVTSTALPPAMCAAVLAAVAKMGEGCEARELLRANVAGMRGAVAGMEAAVPESRVPIFFVPLPDASTATAWHEALRRDDLVVPVAGYTAASPTGLRWVVTSRHRPEDIARLGCRLAELADSAG